MSLQGLSEDQIQNLKAVLLNRVREDGGVAGNISLIRQLGWPDEQYWSIRDSLIDAGDLVLGRGKGGSVRLANLDAGREPDHREQIPQSGQADSYPAEGDLYEPLRLLIREHWVKDKRFGRAIVETTAKQGRRDTGGTWTRPDLVVLSYTTLLYVPNRDFEVITFEVKPWTRFDVTGVYEALAHRRASTRSYLLAAIPNNVLSDSKWTDYIQRIQDESERHGVGFIVVGDPTDYETWEERCEAVRQDPDPHLLNEFLSRQISEGGKAELLEWFR